MCRPSFSDLAPAQQGNFGNGVGPYWLPAKARRWITKTASWFFRSASWRHHDFGYAVGGDRWDRARCDWKFLRAMLRDAMSQGSDDIMIDLEWMWKAPPAILLSLIFYLAVRIGGGWGSFEFRNCYASLDEVLETYR